MLKPTKSALSLITNPKYQFPYEGAKKMLLVEELEDREFLKKLILLTCEELPSKKKKE